MTDQRPARRRRELKPTPSSQTSAFERVLGPEQRRSAARNSRRQPASASQARGAAPQPLMMAPTRRRVPRMHTERFAVPAGGQGGFALPHPQLSRPVLKRPALRRPHLPRPRMPHVTRAGTSQQLDRIIRSRLWIAILGVMLVGIVGMRVEVLKLGTKTGSAVQAAAQLQADNAMYQAKVAELENPSRIANYALAHGLRQPDPTDTKFLAARSGQNIGGAIRSLSTPNASEFETNLLNRETADGDSSAAGGSSSAG